MHHCLFNNGSDALMIKHSWIFYLELGGNQSLSQHLIIRNAWKRNLVRKKAILELERNLTEQNSEELKNKHRD